MFESTLIRHHLVLSPTRRS